MAAIKIGTRRSQLATWQAEFVRDALSSHHPTTTFELAFITTQGDRILGKPLAEIGGKGVFTLELELALLSGEIDLAVHSLKDLPTDIPEGFALGAVPERENPFDAFLSRSGASLDDLPGGATVGTSSLRRGAQLKAYRPDLIIENIRGNVETRIAKMQDVSGPYDATVLAVAGLKRLNRADEITEVINTAIMLPAPGQGALGIQFRADDDHIRGILEPINHPPTQYAVLAERSFLNELEAGCRLPVSAYARFEGTDLYLAGRVNSLDGISTIEVSRNLPIGSMQPHLREPFAIKLGRDSAREAISKGAAALIAAVKEEVAGE